MPVILLTKNLKIYIYPNDHIPPHIHVVGPDCEAKINIQTLECFANYGFSKRDIRRISAFIEDNIDLIREAWEEYHGDE